MIAAFTYFCAAMPGIPDVVHRTAPFYPVQAFISISPLFSQLFRLTAFCKWKLLTIRNLLVKEYRFSELRNGVPEISQKVLTDNLRALEANGLIIRTVYPEVPPRVE